MSSGSRRAVLREELQPHLGQAVLQRLAAFLVPGVYGGQALLEDPAERRVQRRDHRDRRGVVVLASAAFAGDVGTDHAQVEIPRARVDHPPRPGPLAHRERRQPGRHTEALLSAGVGQVDAPGVESDVDPGEGGHTVGQHEGVAAVVHRGGEGGHVVAYAGRGLGVHHRHQRRRGMGGEHGVDVHRGAPREAHRHDLRAAPRRDVDHPLAELTVGRDHDDVAGMDGVDERRLHPRAAGAGEREGERVRRTEDGAQPVARLVQDAQKERVEMPQQRRAERRRRLRIGVGRARAQQGAFDHGHGS